MSATLEVTYVVEPVSLGEWESASLYRDCFGFYHIEIEQQCTSHSAMGSTPGHAMRVMRDALDARRVVLQDIPGGWRAWNAVRERLQTPPAASRHGRSIPR